MLSDWVAFASSLPSYHHYFLCVCVQHEVVEELMTNLFIFRQKYGREWAVSLVQ